MSDKVQQSYESVKHSDPDSMANTEEFVVRIRGLPWSATVEDVQKFFTGCRVKEGRQGIHFTYASDGRASGEAYIEFGSLEDFNRALERNRCHMGKRYVEVFKSKRSEMDYVVKRTKQRSGRDSENVVRLRGLPYECSKEEIAQFFTGCEIIPNGITFGVDRDGRSTGEAYVEFANTDVSERALSKDKETIGHRYIEIFRAKKSDIHNMSAPKIRPLIGSAASSRPRPYDRKRGDRFTRGHPEDRYNQGRGYNRGYLDNRPSDHPGYGRPHSEYNYDRDREEFRDAAYNPYSEEPYARSSNWNIVEPDRPPDFEPNVHSIRMRGLPFKVTENEIVDFFDQIPLQNIHIEYGDGGKATGEAVVEFYNYEDALEAMNKDRRRIKHRYIELFLNTTPESEGNMHPRENQRDYPAYDYPQDREFDEDIHGDSNYSKGAKWVDTAREDSQSRSYTRGREYTGADYGKDYETYDMWYGDGGSSKSNRMQEERYGDAVRIGKKEQFPYNEDPIPGSKGSNYEEPSRSIYHAYGEERLNTRVNNSAIPKSVSRPTQEAYESGYSSTRQTPTVNPQQQNISLSMHNTSGTGGNRMPAGGYQYSDDRNPRTTEMTVSTVGYSQDQMRSASSSTVVTRTAPNVTSQSNKQLQRSTNPSSRYPNASAGYGSYLDSPDAVNMSAGNRYSSNMGQPRANTSYSSNYGRY